MNKFLVTIAIMFLLPLSCYAKKEDNNFPLTIHITAVHMEQGIDGVYGEGQTDSNGNYHSQVNGGESYTWHIFTTHIDGDKIVYQLSTPRFHCKGSQALTLLTMGYSCIVTMGANYRLYIGDYNARWNKNGSLEIQFTDAKGKLKHQSFNIEGEEAVQP